MGILCGVLLGVSLGLIVGLVAGEVTNGNNKDGQPKKTRQQKEDEEWLAWIMAAQSQVP